MLPDRGLKSADRLAQVARNSHAFASDAEADAARAVVTPKLHGSNVQVQYTPDAGVRYGRRSDFLAPGEEHYGVLAAAAALGMPTKIAALYEGLRLSQPTLAGVALYGEVYGGHYPHPDVPATPPAIRKKPVQQGIWYTPEVQLVFFDVQLVLSVDTEAAGAVDGGAGSAAAAGRARVSRTLFLDCDDASTACARAGLPFVPVIFSGSASEACAWAVAHVRDNALAHFNPAGLPLLPANEGEGFVVRLAREAADCSDRAMAKIKNPAFAEVAHGKSGRPPRELGSVDAAGWAVAEKLLLPARAAAVASKLPEADLDPCNLPALVSALCADARADVHFTAADAATLDGSAKAMRAFTSHAFAVMRGHLAGRGAV